MEKYNKKNGIDDHTLAMYAMYVAENTTNEDQIKRLIRHGDLSTKLIGMFNPLITDTILNSSETNEILNHNTIIDELKKDKNEIIKYDANFIETQQMIMLAAYSIDSIADKKQKEENKRISLLKFKKQYID